MWSFFFLFFFLEKIKYLGHIIDKDDRRSDPEKTSPGFGQQNARRHLKK